MQIVSTGDNLHEMSNCLQTICMKCQIPFPEKNKEKYLKLLSAENFTQSAKS